MDLKISSHLPDLVDQYLSHRTQRLAAEKAVKLLKETEEVLKTTIISKLQEADLTAAGGMVGLVKLKAVEEPVCTDWKALQDHIVKTGEFDLLHRRLTGSAVKLRWDDKVEIPGVGRTTLYNLNISSNPK